MTENILLAGGTPRGDTGEGAQRAAKEFGVDVATVEHLMETYGGNYRVVLELTRQSEGLKTALIAGLPHIAAEAVYAARYEMAVTVEDFLSRRTRIDLVARDHGRSCATRIASLLEREIGSPATDEQWARAGALQEDPTC